MSEFDSASISVASAGVQFTPSEIARRQGAAWNGIAVETVEVTRREPFEYGFKAPYHLLIAAERGERDDGETLVDGLPKSTLREFSRKLTFVPAGHKFFGWQQPRVLTRVTYFYIDPRGPLMTPGLAPGLRFAETEFAPRLFFFDQDLWDTARKLKRQAENPDADQRSYAEALSLVLVHELVRLNNGHTPVQLPSRGGLAGWQQKRVAEYIEEHLAEITPLTALAALVDLSPFHFTRAFKQSFGLPPHRYLSYRRIEHAKALLADPRISVTQVGSRLGFSDTSSFSMSFRKHTGLTPTAYRRGLS